jgi:hypothetical protein
MAEAEIEELPVLQTISKLSLKDGDILVVRMLVQDRVPPQHVQGLMQKQSAAWKDVLQRAGLGKCQVVVTTDMTDLSVIDVVSQLDT